MKAFIREATIKDTPQLLALFEQCKLVTDGILVSTEIAWRKDL